MKSLHENKSDLKKVMHETKSDFNWREKRRKGGKMNSSGKEVKKEELKRKDKPQKNTDIPFFL